MANNQPPNNTVERAFDVYRNMSATERKEFQLLCRGYDSAAAPKPTNARPAAKSATKAAPGGGKENAAAS